MASQEQNLVDSENGILLSDKGDSFLARENTWMDLKKDCTN